MRLHLLKKSYYPTVPKLPVHKTKNQAQHNSEYHTTKYHNENRPATCQKRNFTQYAEAVLKSGS
jgi:hypothetical protein